MIDNPFEIESLIIQKIKDRAVYLHKDITEREFEDAIDKASQMIQEAKEEALEIFRSSKNCKHEYTEFLQKGYYSTFGDYKSIYTRECSKCGYRDSFHQDDSIIFPKWVIEAKSQNLFEHGSPVI